MGLAGDPELLFLDEPTTGFDPTARRGAWAMIRNLRTLGKTVLLTTHYLDEAEALADRVAIMVQGEIVAEDTPAGLVASDVEAVIRFRAPTGVSLPDGPKVHDASDGRVEVRSVDPTRDLHALTSWALGEGITLEDLTVSRLSLEDMFLQLTAEGESEDGS